MRSKLVQLRPHKESHDAIRHKTDLISSATSKFINFKWTRMHLVYPLPPLLPKFCITVHSNFSWVLQSSQEKSRTVVIQFFFFFWGRGGGSKVHCGLCENGEWQIKHWQERWLYEGGWGEGKEREGVCARVSIFKFAPSRKLLYRLSGTFTHATRPLPLSIKEDRRKIQIADDDRSWQYRRKRLQEEKSSRKNIVLTSN